MPPIPEIAAITQEGSVSDEPRAVVRRQIDRRVAWMESGDRGRRDGSPIEGALDDDSSATHDFVVTEAGRRSFYLACDADCVDMDIVVLDLRGRVLNDTSMIQEDVVDFEAASAGSYRVRVRMTGCQANPCYYGLQLFRP